ncbi:MAG: hypothetical protein OEM23_00165 [Gemmatimonadota bacterium]|nr:hypothetical protein [Gemmatimonadota bacterium]MDH3426820.1 hypothetical protein [Gemmatimonadota bacterium]
MIAQTLFTVGLVLMVWFGLGHFLGFVQAARAARHDPDMAELTKAMRAQKTRVMGFEASILDFREYFSLNFSVLLWVAAAVGWVAIGLAADPAAAVGDLAGIYGVGMLLLLATSARFRVAQGIVACGLLAVLFGTVWWLA